MTVMRKIDSVIIHCSATKAGQDFCIEDIERWHRARGFKEVGYHYVIRLDGTVEVGREIALAGAHCLGWNERSVGICYIGGLDVNGHPADTRTEEQNRAMIRLLEDLKRKYRIVSVVGHRDTSPDLNGNGIVEPHEFIKSCPCFDVGKWLALFLFLLLLSACGSSVRYRESRYVEVDSTTVAGHSSRIIDMQQAEQEVSELVNEYMEEIVVAWETDTLGMKCVNRKLPQNKSFSVIRRRVERGRKGRQKNQSGHSCVEADSSLAVENLLMKTDDRKEKQQIKKGRIWEVGMVVGILILCILFLRKFFIVDNQ